MLWEVTNPTSYCDQWRRGRFRLRMISCLLRYYYLLNSLFFAFSSYITVHNAHVISIALAITIQYDLVLTLPRAIALQAWAKAREGSQSYSYHLPEAFVWSLVRRVEPSRLACMAHLPDIENKLSCLWVCTFPLLSRIRSHAKAISIVCDPYNGNSARRLTVVPRTWGQYVIWEKYEPNVASCLSCHNNIFQRIGSWMIEYACLYHAHSEQNWGPSSSLWRPTSPYSRENRGEGNLVLVSSDVENRDQWLCLKSKNCTVRNCQASKLLDQSEHAWYVSPGLAELMVEVTNQLLVDLMCVCVCVLVLKWEIFLQQQLRHDSLDFLLSLSQMGRKIMWQPVDQYFFTSTASVFVLTDAGLYRSEY